MKVILIQNPYNQDKISAFTEEHINQAVNLACNIYATNVLDNYDINIHELNDNYDHDYLSWGKLKHIITRYIKRPQEKLYQMLGEEVYIYIVNI